MEPPTSGTMALGGRNPFALKPADLAVFRNTEIGFVFQDHCLLPQCSVLENVLVPTLVAPKAATNGGDPGHLARRLIDEVGLSDRIDHRPAELSGGEKQRVAIARALICNPRLVLCDEPTGNLDQKAAESVSALLLDLHRQHRNVLITVTHSPQLAGQFPIRFALANTRLVRVDAATAVSHG